jgi:hypothetical protein
MSPKTALITVLVVVGAIILTACGSPECSLKLDSDGALDIQVNPPGETGEGKLAGELKKAMNFSAGKMTAMGLSGTLTKVYSESGNEYTIELFAEIKNNNRLSAYELKVTGGVYGSTPHICSK